VFWNKLEKWLSIFNEKEFSNLDEKKWFSEYELKEFKAKIDTAIDRIWLLKTYKEFKKAHENATDYSLWIGNVDKFYAKRLDMNSIWIPWVLVINITDKIFDFVNDKIWDWVEISQEELQKMKDRKFGIIEKSVWLK